MNYKSIRMDEQFHTWKKYAPIDGQYVKYAETEPSVVAVGHKIDDVYYSFANARASLLFADSDDFGDLSDKSDLSMKYTRSHFFTYSILEYAICLDISWQVLWAYIQPASFEYLVKQKYVEMEKECTSENVHLQLNCAIAQHGINALQAQRLKDILTAFEIDLDVKKLRSLYNAIKHHGMIHFKGLGANFSEMSLGFNGKSTPILCRKSYTMEEIEELLYAYHFKFERYFNSIIAEIIPIDYFETKVKIEDYLNTVIRMNSVLDK